MSNSCCNPFIYSIYNEKFKREFRKRRKNISSFTRSSIRSTYVTSSTRKTNAIIQSDYMPTLQGAATTITATTYHTHANTDNINHTQKHSDDESENLNHIQLMDMRGDITTNTTADNTTTSSVTATQKSRERLNNEHLNKIIHYNACNSHENHEMNLKSLPPSSPQQPLTSTRITSIKFDIKKDLPSTSLFPYHDSYIHCNEDINDDSDCHANDYKKDENHDDDCDDSFNDCWNHKKDDTDYLSGGNKSIRIGNESMNAYLIRNSKPKIAGSKNGDDLVEDETNGNRTSFEDLDM